MKGMLAGTLRGDKRKTKSVRQTGIALNCRAEGNFRDQAVA
jgi:hypothetical protein